MTVMTPRVRLAAAAVLAVAALAGCGSATDSSPPTGVDGLVVPTPAPDPDDFVARVDNPWLPLADGARWQYDGTSAAGDPLTVTVEAATGPVHDGIATTTVLRVTRDDRGREVERVEDRFAQDRAGNVWWFGRDDTWFAEPGLAMPAEPRLGDGFVVGEPATGLVRAEVDDLAASATVPAGEYDDLLAIDVVGEADEPARRELYARGVGLVSSEPEGPGTTTGLVAHDEPR